MSKLTDKAAYIKGLAEGMKLEDGSNEQKLLLNLIDVVGDMASDLEELEEAHDDLSDFVDSIDEDLEQLEDILGDEDADDDEEFDEDDEDEDDFDDEDDDGGEFGEIEGAEGGNIYVECVCPKCHALFYAPEGDVDAKAKFVCPRCGEKVEPLMDYEEDIPVAEKAEEE